MPLAIFQDFLKKLRHAQPGSSSARRRKSSSRADQLISGIPETLEIRLVPTALPSLIITPAVTVAEGDTDTQDAVFTVTLTAASDVPVTVSFSTLDDTATTADHDYEADADTLTFAPGETSKTITVKVDGDTKHESDEKFDVVLFNAANAKLSKQNYKGVGTITNDDDAPTASIATPTIVYEGNTGTKVMNFTVTLSNATDQPVNLHFATADGTATVADSDYDAASGTLTFAPGETTKNIAVTIHGDTKVESNETFTVTISAPTGSTSNTTITTATATGTIGDDDTQPVLSVKSPTAIDEGNTGTTQVLFTVTLSSASTQTVTVAYATADGTATAGSDYTAASGTLSFAPGELTKTIAVTVNGDTLSEANETILLNLSAPTNANIATGTGTATITNDDLVAPTISLSSGVAVTEGNTGTTDATFHLTLSQASGQTVTVTVATADGTAKTSDDDYVANTQTITFAPGETDKTFVVQVKGDTKLEGNETFSVNLTSPVNATVATASRTATITNDDGGFVSIAKTTDGAETTPPTKGKFTVTQSGVSPTDTVITYTIAGTATPGEGHDYQTLSGSVTIPAGQTTATIDVNTLNDSEDEDTETVIVTLTGFSAHDSNIALDSDPSKLTATVNIFDAGDVPSLQVGGGAVTFTKGHGPIAVLPLAIVGDANLAGGTMTISVDAVSTDKKFIDQFKFPSSSAFGTTDGPQKVNDKLTLVIDLNQSVTAAQIQAFLRGITFNTKKQGLATATRTLQVSLTDANSHTAAITQTINVTAPA